MNPLDEYGVLDLNFKDLYPDFLQDVRDRLQPWNMVLDIPDDNGEKIPDDDCIIVQWKDDKGEHKYRFLKPGVVSTSEVLEKLNKERSALKAKATFFVNFPTTFDENVAKMRDFVRHRLAGNERPKLYIVTGPYCSGKSFIADVLIAATGGRSKVCSMPLVAQTNREYQSLIDEALKERDLLVCWELKNEEKQLKDFTTLAQKYLFSTDVLLIISSDLLQKLDHALVNNDCEIIACAENISQSIQKHQDIRRKEHVARCAHYIRS